MNFGRFRSTETIIEERFLVAKKTWGMRMVLSPNSDVAQICFLLYLRLLK